MMHREVNRQNSITFELAYLTNLEQAPGLYLRMGVTP